MITSKVQRALTPVPGFPRTVLCSFAADPSVLEEARLRAMERMVPAPEADRK